MEPLPPRQNPPKDGAGPRGFPDCYYTSRVLDSTFRYVRFLKKLRALEEEQRRGAINSMKEMKDKQYSDFFIRCDRRSLINNVARRVDLCMMSYQEDLKAKRQRLTDLLTAEEEMNIRKFVEQAQAGTEALWQDKKDRLAYLLAKRQKEHEEKYRDTPLSKCVHVHPCIVKKRAVEAQQIQLYQMKENQAKKMAEKELDKMWHEVAMKEAEALAARMELDTIERLRREHECKQNSDQQLALRREQRRKEQELLKEESLRLRKMFEAYTKKEDEEGRRYLEKRAEAARIAKEALQEREATLKKQDEENQLINDTWDSLAALGIADEKAHEEMRKQKERDLDICNKKMAALKKDKNKTDATDNALMDQEAQRQQAEYDARRCKHIIKQKKASDEVHAGIVQQIKDNAAARAQRKTEHNDQVEYERQLFKQLQQLVEHRQMTEAQARKLYQTELLQQMEYSKLLKDRLMQEELEQRKKCQLATEEYELEIKRMLCRPFFSDDVHPFMKQMAKGLKMQEKCPCSKADYCAVPTVVPKVNLPDKPGTAPKDKKVSFGSAPGTTAGTSPSK